MHVFVPNKFDTGRLKNKLSNCEEVDCDFLSSLESLKPGECVELRWTKSNRRRCEGSFLYIARFWVTPWGTRKLRLQYHKINQNGTFGPREIVLERHNGRIVR